MCVYVCACVRVYLWCAYVFMYVCIFCVQSYMCVSVIMRVCAWVYMRGCVLTRCLYIDVRVSVKDLNAMLPTPYLLVLFSPL